MPAPRQEESIAQIAVPVTAPLKQWFKNYARRQDRTMASEIGHILTSLYQADLEKAGLVKELIG